MDSAFPSAFTNMNFMNSLATPSNSRLTNFTTSTPTYPSKARISLQFKNQKIESFSVHCSTKPGTDKDNATDDNFRVELEPSSNSRIQEEVTSGSNHTLSNFSSSSSFSRGLVFDLGSSDSWDSAEIGSPVVKRYLSDEEERWYMWYYGRSNGSPVGDSIGLAVSSNGIHWERGKGTAKSASDVGLVMNCSNDWWAFDTEAIRPSEVVIMSSAKVRVNNSLYWLYYTGFSSEIVDFSLTNSLKFNLENPEKRVFLDANYSHKILKSLPGLAMSQDGRHWARIEGEHHSGALFDVGSEGEWDSLFISSPQVVFHEIGDIRMYYHSFDIEKGHFAIGIARSRDGIKWLKLGKILGGGRNGSFDELGAMNASVVRDRKDGKYVMVYEGVDEDGRKSIGLAFSEDGLKNWRRFENDGPLLKKCEEQGWDCEGIGSPCLVQMDGEKDEWRLYYRGIGKEGKTGIGMAVSQGSEISKFERWTGFHF